jgi:hypothetical protein
VNRVRNHITDQLRARLAEQDEAAAVLACSMERREGGAQATVHFAHTSCNVETDDCLAAEYEFNEPMLEDIFAQPQVRIATTQLHFRSNMLRFFNCGTIGVSQVKATDSNRTPIVLAMLFLQPGKHAGEGGDIDQLVEAAQTRYATLVSETTDGGTVAQVQQRTVLKTVRAGLFSLRLQCCCRSLRLLALGLAILTAR